MVSFFSSVWFDHQYIFFFFCMLVFIDYDESRQDEFSFGNRPVANGGDRQGAMMSKLGSSSTAELNPKAAAQSKPTSMPPASVMTRLILIMVWRKLIRNPNTYSSLIGLTWSLVSFKYAKVISPTHFPPFFCVSLAISLTNIVILQVGD